jgi:hypothetical protein
VTCVVLLQAHVEELLTHVEAVDKFAPDGFFMSQSGCCWTTVTAAVTVLDRVAMGR